MNVGVLGFVDYEGFEKVFKGNIRELYGILVLYWLRLRVWGGSLFFSGIFS